jgi:hypothetical protein
MTLFFAAGSVYFYQNRDREGFENVIKFHLLFPISQDFSSGGFPSSGSVYVLYHSLHQVDLMCQVPTLQGSCLSPDFALEKVVVTGRTSTGCPPSHAAKPYPGIYSTAAGARRFSGRGGRACRTCVSVPLESLAQSCILILGHYYQIKVQLQRPKQAALPPLLCVS